MGYKINDGFAVKFYFRNLVRAYNPTFDLNLVSAVVPILHVHENPENTIVHDRTDPFGSFIRYIGNVATPWTIGAVDGTYRPTADLAYRFVQYVVLIVVDKDGNDILPERQPRPDEITGFPVPPLGFDDVLGIGQINYDENPVPPARILTERFLPEDGNGNITGLPPKPDDNFKRLAMGLSSKTYLTTDISFEDLRKINQTPTIFKEGGHYDFAEKLPRKLTVAWPAVRNPADGTIFDRGLVDGG